METEKLILICLIAFYTGKILYNIKQQRIEGFKVTNVIHVIRGGKELDPNMIVNLGKKTIHFKIKGKPDLSISVDVTRGSTNLNQFVTKIQNELKKKFKNTQQKFVKVRLVTKNLVIESPAENSITIDTDTKNDEMIDLLFGFKPINMVPKTIKQTDLKDGPIIQQFTI